MNKADIVIRNVPISAWHILHARSIVTHTPLPTLLPIFTHVMAVPLTQKVGLSKYY